MKFKGKVSAWFYVLVIGTALFYLPLIFVFLFVYQNIFALTMLLISLIAIEGFCVPILLRNFVQLQQGEAVVVFGWIQKRIPYQEIVAFSETNSPTSSFAASFDRIEIKCKNNSSIMIAVTEKERFFEEIGKHISNIDV